jgi:hypothetical protein
MLSVKICPYLVIVLVSALLVACSSLKTYPNDLPKNVRVQTKTSTGSIFQKLNAGLNIYEVDRQCQTAYLGTIDLDRSVMDVGLPVQKQLYLEFTFDKSARLASSSSSIYYGTLLRPAPARQYVVDVSYIDDLYQVKMREKGSTSNLGYKPLESCQQK